MAEKNETRTPVSSNTITCNLQNPTRACRVIYDGITDNPITIYGGDTKKNVTLHRDVADELRARNKAKPNSDLRVLPLTSDADAETEKTVAA